MLGFALFVTAQQPAYLGHDAPADKFCQCEGDVDDWNTDAGCSECQFSYVGDMGDPYAVNETIQQQDELLQHHRNRHGNE